MPSAATYATLSLYRDGGGEGTPRLLFSITGSRLLAVVLFHVAFKVLLLKISPGRCDVPPAETSLCLFVHPLFLFHAGLQ